MKIINAAVILLALRENETVPLNLPRDRAWYERFFFDPRDGIRAYFERVSSGDVLVHGRVLDWLVVNDLNWKLNTTSDRGPATQLAIKLHEDRGMDFSEYNLVALMVAAPSMGCDKTDGTAPKHCVNDGSSGTTSSSGKYHHAILARDGASFDFMVHEVGHGLGLDHSCGNNPQFKTLYGYPTEYGHPFCVMSASSYGGRGASWTAPAAGDPRPEYVGRCPMVNAATCQALGWIDAQVYNPATDGLRSFVLTNLEWARRGVTAPPAVQVTTPEGAFVIEYRGPAAWDLGQQEPMVIVNQGAGGRADLMHPGTHSGTYLGHIAKGFDPNRAGSVVNVGAFGVELMDLSKDLSTATVRLRPGRVELTPSKLTARLQLRHAVTLSEGSTTFAPGERLCVSGTWGYQHVGNHQEAIFEATWARARAETTFTWEVAGTAITDAAGALQWRTTLREATPNLTHATIERDVEVAYEVESIPGGSKLTLRNRPGDETYDIAAKVKMTDPVASAEATETVCFTGMQYLYPPEFYEAEQRCLDQLRDPSRSPSHRVVLPWDLWSRLGRTEVDALRFRVAVLEQMVDHDDFARAVRQLARDFGIQIEEIQSVRLVEGGRLADVRLHDEPPALPSESWASS